MIPGLPSCTARILQAYLYIQASSFVCRTKELACCYRRRRMVYSSVNRDPSARFQKRKEKCRDD